MPKKQLRIPFVLIMSLLFGTALSQLIRAVIIMTTHHFDPWWWTGGFISGVVTSAAIVYPVCIALPVKDGPDE